MSIMEIMDRSGHTEVHWDAADETSIRVARETFTRMTSEGYRAFHISPKGGQDEAKQKGPRLERRP